MSGLAAELREMIAAEGPVSVERYMALCLQHPRYGYYTTRKPIGRTGDFITAPEIHQMFGELIGLWAAQVWMMMGAPHVLRLVELGPGRGTLMADALRAARVVPGFLESVWVDLVETSPRLTAAQRATLDGAAKHIEWYRTIEELPDGPVIVLANEFFDVLPVRHYIRGDRNWHERVIGLTPDGTLHFGMQPEPIAIDGAAGVPGQILEVGHVGLRVMQRLAERVATSGGAILVCDYGHGATGLGETLQAVRGHAYADILAAPGEADLTAHVDFAALGRMANLAGTVAYGPVPQGVFLRHLGIVERAAALSAHADAAQAAAIEAALVRLTAPESSMATLFKVLAVMPKGASMPPGFEATR